MDADEFRLLVFEVVALIPEGRATSYGAIARAIGYPTLSRRVGCALAGGTAQQIPAQRVVNSQGVLSGRHAFRPPSAMQKLLEAEGIEIKDNRIANWKSVFWDPLTELATGD